MASNTFDINLVDVFNSQHVGTGATYGFLLVLYSNFSLFLRYATCNYTVTLKAGLWVIEGHRNRSVSTIRQL